MYREINVWYTPLQSVFQVTLSSLSAVLFHCPVFVAPASGLNFHSPSDVPVSQISLLSGSVTGTDLKCRPVLVPNIYQYNYQWLTNIHTISHTHTHTHLTALFPGLPGWAGTRKVKPIWILLKQETVSGSGISWAICKSAPCSRQITTPATHHSVFLQAGCPSCCPTNSVKALNGFIQYQ